MQITVKGTKITNRGQLKFGNSFSNTKPELKAMMANCTKQKNEKLTSFIQNNNGNHSVRRAKGRQMK